MRPKKSMYHKPYTLPHIYSDFCYNIKNDVNIFNFFFGERDVICEAAWGERNPTADSFMR